MMIGTEIQVALPPNVLRSRATANERLAKKGNILGFSISDLGRGRTYSWLHNDTGIKYYYNTQNHTIKVIDDQDCPDYVIDELSSIVLRLIIAERAIFLAECGYNEQLKKVMK